MYPPNFARPLEIAIGASDGASVYGNKFGEPLLTGFARSFGLRLPNGERREWVKPIMFSGGIGALDHFHVTKETAQVGKRSQEVVDWLKISFSKFSVFIMFVRQQICWTCNVMPKCG